MKKIVSIVMTILIAIIPMNISFANGDNAPLSVSSKSAILMDVGSGQVLYEKNAHDKLPPASVTKVMTMLLVCEALDSGKITLNDNVQAGDKIRVYANGGSTYPQMQAAIIEFELYNPSEKTLAGVGSVMCNTGASMGIISASVSSTLKITNQLKITIYCLTNSVHAAGSSVYVNKVERVRFVSTTTQLNGDEIPYGSNTITYNKIYEDVEGEPIDGDTLTYGGGNV